MNHTPTAPQAHNLNDLRGHLMETLAALRDQKNPMEVDRARAIAQVGSVLVDTARVEVDYVKATKARTSQFMQPAAIVAQQVAHEVKAPKEQSSTDSDSAAPASTVTPAPRTMPRQGALQTAWRKILTDEERGVAR